MPASPVLQARLLPDTAKVVAKVQRLLGTHERAVRRQAEGYRSTRKNQKNAKTTKPEGSTYSYRSEPMRGNLAHSIEEESI